MNNLTHPSRLSSHLRLSEPIRIYPPPMTSY